MKDPLVGPIAHNIETILAHSDLPEEDKEIITELVHRAYWWGYGDCQHKIFRDVIETGMHPNAADNWPITYGEWKPEKSIQLQYKDPSVLERGKTDE